MKKGLSLSLTLVAVVGLFFGTAFVSGGNSVEASEVEPTVTPILEPQAYLPLVMHNYPPPVVTITWPTEGLHLKTTSNCIITVQGTVERAPAGSYVLLWVHTNTWYLQPPYVVVPAPSGSWQARPVYLAGQGVFNDHIVLAQLYDAQGNLLAEGEVSGVVRDNSCYTP